MKETKPIIRTLRIQLTEKCNLRCLFCCHEGPVCNYNIIKDSNIINLINACHDILHIQRVKFTGGEPLLHDGDILDVMKRCHDLGIEWSIVTNATDLSKMKNYLAIDGFDITVSLPVPLDSPNASYWEITHCDYEHVYQCFHNVKETIYYAASNHRNIKWNYVLCRDKNDSEDMISRTVSFARKNPCIDLRFLETVINNTNDADNRMAKYRVTATDAINTIKRAIPDVRIDDSRRSHTRLFFSDGSVVRLVKFFCSDECIECPDDKTSLWLTPTGGLKKCAFRHEEKKIYDWTYGGICNTLVDMFSNELRNQ